MQEKYRRLIKKIFYGIGILVLINITLIGISILENGMGGWNGENSSQILGVAVEKATVEDIKKLSKSQLTQLFYSAPPPSFMDIKGEYKAETIPVGILSPAADFFTHNFFGPGRWIGKAFFPIKENCGQGYNIFKDTESEFYRTREMDTFIGPSEIDDNDSFHIVYKSYNSGMVNSMHDELRKINAHLIIGMGYMLAGGGSINPAPFILFGKPTKWIGPDN